MRTGIEKFLALHAHAGATHAPAFFCDLLVAPPSSRRNSRLQPIRLIAAAQNCPAQLSSLILLMGEPPYGLMWRQHERFRRTAYRLAGPEGAGGVAPRPVHVRLSKKVGADKIDDFVSASVENRFDHVKVEIHDLVELEAGRHDQFLPIDGNIDQSGTGMREGLLERGPDLLRIIDMNSENARAF